jgi:hypothetical protein
MTPQKRKRLEALYAEKNNIICIFSVFCFSNFLLAENSGFDTDPIFKYGSA